MEINKILARKPRAIKPTNNSGFTLLELIVVIAGLGILASLAIPNFLKYLEFAQVDEAKSLLNAVASECLLKYRQVGWNTSRDYTPKFVEDRAPKKEGEKAKLPGNYDIKDNKTTCEHIEIHDPGPRESNFPTLSFRMTSAGKILKSATPRSKDSIGMAESWGSTSISPELLAEIEYLNQCSSDKSVCDTNFNSFAKNQRDGGPWQVGQWRGACKWPRDTEAGCAATQVWTFEGRIINSQAELDKLRADKLGAECTKARNDAIERFNPAGEGIINLPDCGIYERHYNGSQLDCNSQETCEISYRAATEKKRQERCTAAEGRWKDSGINGKFSEAGCEVKWQCNKVILTSQADYDSSTCAAPPPPPAKVCRKPDNKYCKLFPTLQVCQPICN